MSNCFPYFYSTVPHACVRVCMYVRTHTHTLQKEQVKCKDFSAREGPYYPYYWGSEQQTLIGTF